MSDKIRRREFVRWISLGGAAIGCLPSAAGTRAREHYADSFQDRPEQQKDDRNPEDYYRFSDDGRECIILRPDTPAPWMNLLANDTFLTWITHRGCIECALLDRSLNGLTNPQSTSGLVYVRDRKSGAYFCLNSPKREVPWQCTHGLGYTTISMSELNLEAEVTYFVPRNNNLVLWIIKLKDQRGASRDLDLFTTVEWNLGDQNKSIIFAGHGGGGDPFTGGSQFNLYKKVAYTDGVIYANQLVWRTLAKAHPWPYTGFMASSIAPTSYECVRQTFLGPGRSPENPIQVEAGECSNNQLWSNNEYPWGVLHHRLRLRGSGSQSIVIVTGMARDAETIKAKVQKYANLSQANRELSAVKVFWSDFLNKSIQIQTPEAEIDRTLNIWTKYQWRNNMQRSQTTDRIGLGFWSYGLVSNTSGGAISEVAAQPHDLEIVRDAVSQFMALQYRDTTLGKLSDEAPLLSPSDLERTWPPVKSRGPFQFPHSHETDNIYPIVDYVVESGDFDFLDQKLPFLDGGHATVFDHICVALEYSTQGLSERSLPKFCTGFGDWNDELNGVCTQGKAESVMMAMELCHHLRECASLARRYGREKEASKWMETYARIKDACNHYAWDGEWYVRAFADGGPTLRPIGTSKDREGRIYLETQCWAVLSGVAEGDRARQCMESVGKYLVSPYGPMLLAPAYTQIDPQVGIQSAYAPGWRNANVYFRPAGWAVIAACLADLPELAFDMYKKASLSELSRDTRRYLREPYVYPENVNGPDHPFAGEGQYQWNLGEGANWMWRSYVYYILGVRPVFDGLLVEPRMPATWPRFSVVREFRNAHYEIQVENPNHRSGGVKQMTVDGGPVTGNVIPDFADGNLHRVQIVLGS